MELICIRRKTPNSVKRIQFNCKRVNSACKRTRLDCKCIWFILFGNSVKWQFIFKRVHENNLFAFEMHSSYTWFVLKYNCFAVFGIKIHINYVSARFALVCTQTLLFCAWVTTQMSYNINGIFPIYLRLLYALYFLK